MRQQTPHERTPDTPLCESNDSEQLNQTSFSSALSFIPRRWSRTFTSLVPSIPYPGDGIIYKHLSKIYGSSTVEDLERNTAKFRREVGVLSLFHLALASLFAIDAVQDAGRLLEGKREGLFYAPLEGIVALVATSVTISQLILAHRMTNRTEKILKNPSRRLRLTLPPLAKPEVIRAAALYLLVAALIAMKETPKNEVGLQPTSAEKLDAVHDHNQRSFDSGEENVPSADVSASSRARPIKE